MMGELLIIRQCCNEDCKDSVFGRFECYFSLERKVTKSSRLHLSRYSASFVRCRLWTRFAQTAQPPGALYGYFSLRSPNEAFHRTLCVLLGLPILLVKSESFCSISIGVGHPKRKQSFLWKASAGERPRRRKTQRPEHLLFERSEFRCDSVVFFRSSEAGVALIFCLLFHQGKSRLF